MIPADPFAVAVQTENESDMPQSNPIIITFDDQTSDDDEQPPPLAPTSTYTVADDEWQAIKRLQHVQEDVIRRTNSVEATAKATVPKNPTPPVVVTQDALLSTDELSALLEKR